MELKTYLSAERGRAAQLAAFLGVTPVTVHQWANSINNKHVPSDRCPAIEKFTNCEVTCEELRKDIGWVRMKDKTWPNPCGRPLVDHSKAA